MGKSKRRKRQAARPSPPPFVDGRDSYAKALARLRKAEVRRRSSLKRVAEIPGAEVDELTDQELLERLGLSAFAIQYFDVGAGQNARNKVTGHGDGGHTYILRAPEGTLQTLIVIRKRDINEETMAAINIAIFLHELGHVDDFENGINLTIGTGESNDVRRMEEYAHHFACRHMMKGGFQLPLAFYLADALDQLTQCSVDHIASAAESVLHSPEAAQYKRYAGSLYTSYWYDSDIFL